MKTQGTDLCDRSVERKALVIHPRVHGWWRGQRSCSVTGLAVYHHVVAAAGLALQDVCACVSPCRILFDGNEEEYEDFYDYAAGGAGAEGADAAAASSTAADGTGAADSAKQLALALDGLSIGGSGAAGGWELAVPSQGSAGGKVLGSRELARYYKQRPKPQDNRRSVIVNTIIAQYRSLGLATKTSTPPVVERAAQRQQQQMQKRQHQLLYSRNNVNFNLPKNVTY
jgi:pre-60S factor REI1